MIGVVRRCVMSNKFEVDQKVRLKNLVDEDFKQYNDLIGEIISTEPYDVLLEGGTLLQSIPEDNLEAII